MKNNKKIVLLIIIIFTSGIVSGVFLFDKISNINSVTADGLQLDEQEATIRAINKVMPAVVSIIVSEEDIFEAIDVITGKFEPQMYMKQKQKGTGFLISSDGYILTNKHVVDVANQDSASFRVILNTGMKYYAQLIGKDPLNDLAVLKIYDKDLPFIEMGDSSKLNIGSSVIAIGNALGRYQNSATKGIVSALGRSMSAVDSFGKTEMLDNVIQTDAKINLGNSGGPLINLSGKVVGVNSAIESAGSAIGFAIPINDARGVIDSIRERGIIVRPFIGIRYRMISPEILLEHELGVDHGAWVVADAEEAVVSDSPADVAGIIEEDIIFEINAIKIDEQNPLKSVIQRYKPGDKIGLKIKRGEEELIKIVELGEIK